MFQTINQPELTNATFMGWFTAPGTGGTQVTSSMVFNGTSDITLYAHRKLAPVTVEVKLNTGCKKAAGCPTGWAQIATAKDTAGCFLYDYHYRLCARMVLQSPTPSVGATCLAKFQLSTSAVITDSWVDLINGNILFAKTPEVILNFLTFNIFKFSFG
ncbi:MAG: InlB B-repeat-containing protein [Candidatus Peribacteria bacterium]|jgi:hypothetical protein|nr:InlB B-repeat-containing protein [Candidatus Peribacteria bacterium]